MTHIRFVVLLCLLGVINAQSSCNETNIYQTYDDLVSCLQSVPFSESIKNGTLTTLRSIIPSYVFVDSVQNSADPVHIPMNINLEDELNQIEATIYNTDQELQQAFASLFAQLEDAHTRYTKPLEPYCVSSFVLPFKLYSRVISGTQKIYLDIIPELLTQYESIYPPLSQSIDGYEVSSINTQNAVESIGLFANSSVGYSKDYSARFNLAIDGYGGDFPPMYTWRNQSLQGIPESSTMNFTLIDNTGGTLDVTLFWMGIYDSNFTIDKGALEESKIGVHQLDYLGKAFGLDSSRDLEEPEGNPDVYYQMVNDNTGVLRIYTFSPSSPQKFISTVEDAICYFNENNITQLIIDVSQNGGGSICLGYAVERFLFPDVTPMTGAYDIKASSLFTLFSNVAPGKMCDRTNETEQVCGNPMLSGYFTPCTWYDWYSKDQYYDSTWFIPGNEVTRGGVEGTYSTFITQNCEDQYRLWIPGKATSLNLSPNNIIVVSDGLCGSTCSVFSRHLQLNHKVKTITTGGVLGGQQPSLTSFPGGEVVELSYIFDLANRYGVSNSPLVPPPLPTTADFRFAIREIFGWDDINLSSIPQEFTYLPGDWQVFYEEAFDNHTAIWNSVLPYFEKCSPQLRTSCSIENGIGSVECINGSLSTSCIATECYPGYELNIYNGTCVACDKGYYRSGIGSGECKVCPTLLPSNCHYSESGITSSSCPFTCSDCVTCPTTEPESETLNQICMETWAFCIMIVAIVVIAMSLAGILSCFVTARYYERQKKANTDTFEIVE